MNFLVTGAGCPGFYATISMLKALGNHKVFSCDPYPDSTPGPLCTEECFKVPFGSDPDYVSVVRGIVASSEINHIIPLTDPELLPLSSNDVGAQVWVSPPQSIELLLNKLELYEKVPDLAPKLLSFSASEVIAYVYDRGPCFVKLHTGHGSRGTKKLVTKKEWLDKFAHSKPESYGSIFPVDEIESVMNDNKLLFVENLPGAEYSIDCVFHNSLLTCYGVRHRALIKNGICQNAEFIHDIHGEFRDAIDLLFRDIPVNFNINVQLKRDERGTLKLLEVNPRVSGSLDSFSPHSINMLSFSMGNTPQALDLGATISGSTSYRVSKFIG